MKYLIQKVLAIFSAHPSLSAINGPYMDEVPGDAARPTEAGGTEPEYCIYTASNGASMTYLTDEEDVSETMSIVLTVYTTENGRDREIDAAIKAQFNNKQFDFTNGRCEWSRVVSSQLGYAGLNERVKRLYSVTISISFDIHVITDTSTDPAYLPT